MTYETKSPQEKAAEYIAHVAHRRARAERRKNRIARLILATAIILFVWAVSLPAVVAH